MTTRLVLLVALALTTPVLAGCIGGDRGEPVRGSRTNGTNGGAGPGDYPPPTLRTALTVAVVGDAEWIRPGEPVTFTATAPEGATGEVTYAWSIGALPEPKAEGADPHAGHGDGAHAEDSSMLCLLYTSPSPRD